MPECKGNYKGLECIMKKFMDDDFLLSNEVSRKLYHEYAKTMPIIDYHCHISPKEIYEDKKFNNITKLWLSSDHYKWRQMRSNGVEEKYITGDGSDFDKFFEWVKTLEMAIGNPLYHWSHLELKRYFGYDGCLNEKTAKEVWQICNEKLGQEDMTARGIIKKSNVKLICTTDDPVDTLCWHEKLYDDPSFDVKVLPTFRPDRAMSIEKPDYLEYINELKKVSGIEIDSFKKLIEALRNRMDYFVSMGCVISDHGLSYVMYEEAMDVEVEKIFASRLLGEIPDSESEAKFKTTFLLKMGREYHKRGWAMQLHYGVKRDNNERLFNKLGADAGVDCINNYTPSSKLADFLNALDKNNELPKTIIYSLNPSDNAAIGSVIGCFQDASTVGKIQQGSAWWFNDNLIGMREQMKSLANFSLLGNFIGMLTDSRSFLSYVRHEYFRRIMCDLIGQMVENGEYPKDFEILEKIVKGISYKNAVRYFGFNLEGQYERD